jgi:FkbM family methyltransferase
MRIGIQLIAYNSAEVLEELLAPWLKLKDRYDLKVWVGSGQFKTYNQMGCENLNGPTIKLLEEMIKEGKIDYLFQPDPDNLLDDAETRDKCIPWMKEQDIDLMIQLDSDEFYTEQEVENLITFIEENPEPSVYNVVFNNIVGDSREDWVRFAVGWIKRHGGIKNYYFDCHFSFIEGEYRDAPNITVPKTLVHPTHLTWTHNKNTTGPSHIQEKIDYQNRVYGGDVGVTRCEMIWDEKEQRIKRIGEFNWGKASEWFKETLKYEFFSEKGNVYETIFKVEEGDVVMDVGASIGPFSYLLRDKKIQHLYAIEPSLPQIETLIKNIGATPHTIIPNVISDKDLAIDSYFGLGYEDKSFKVVEAKSFMDVVNKYKIDKIDFLKTDCEGGEYNIFKVENICWLKENMKKCSGEWHLSNPEEKKKFREFRDVFLRVFPNHEVHSVDGINIKWDLWNEHFIEYYNQVIIYINNK